MYKDIKKFDLKISLSKFIYRNVGGSFLECMCTNNSLKCQSCEIESKSFLQRENCYPCKVYIIKWS
jgi:hypothetical protein